jgi:hypothetical protein
MTSESREPAAPAVPEAAYTGEPAFFTPDGSGVTFEYVQRIRDTLGLKQGQSLARAIAANQSDARLGEALREALRTMRSQDGVSVVLAVTQRDAWIATFERNRKIAEPDTTETRNLSALLRAPARDATGGGA